MNIEAGELLRIDVAYDCEGHSPLGLWVVLRPFDPVAKYQEFQAGAPHWSEDAGEFVKSLVANGFVRPQRHGQLVIDGTFCDHTMEIVPGAEQDAQG